MGTTCVLEEKKEKLRSSNDKVSYLMVPITHSFPCRSFPVAGMINEGIMNRDGHHLRFGGEEGEAEIKQ